MNDGHDPLFAIRSYDCPKSRAARDEHEALYMRNVTEEYVRVGSKVYAHCSVSHLDVIDLLAGGYRCEIGK